MPNVIPSLVGVYRRIAKYFDIPRSVIPSLVGVCRYLRSGQLLELSYPQANGGVSSTALVNLLLTVVIPNLVGVCREAEKSPNPFQSYPQSSGGSSVGLIRFISLMSYPQSNGGESLASCIEIATA